MTAKVAVLSDLHANLEALTSVLKKVEGERVVCLGDFVDYGAEPDETIARIKDLRVDAVLGNHDNAALTGDTSMFNANAAISSEWTRKTLTKESREFLAGLPLEVRVDFEGGEAYFTHGSPSDNLWEYVDPRTHHLLFGHYLN
ncbi:MAG TPA: metallophosphoesterase family protein, partial [Nitrososphaerales archaeon]|nr:metallophosphoesterase family protein [Nitrososphaerales archaeon]